MYLFLSSLYTGFGKNYQCQNFRKIGGVTNGRSETKSRGQCGIHWQELVTETKYVVCSGGDRVLNPTKTQFTNGQPEVLIKARGKAISRAVDVAEIVRRRFLQDVQIKAIEIGTEERELEDKTKLNVSSMTIVLGK